MVLSTRLVLSAAITLATYAKADFTVFYGTESYYGSSQSIVFFWMNNPPDCDDFGNVSSDLNQVDDYTGSSIGAQCTNDAGESPGCFPGEGGVSKLQWNDDNDEVDYGTMTSCSLGNGAAIQPNDSGSFDLVDSTGAVRGNCVVPSDPQQVDCPADYTDFSGAAIFQCTSDCVAINSN